jgi:hypothetical protein
MQNMERLEESVAKLPRKRGMSKVQILQAGETPLSVFKGLCSQGRKNKPA